MNSTVFEPTLEIFYHIVYLNDRDYDVRHETKVMSGKSFLFKFFSGDYDIIKDKNKFLISVYTSNSTIPWLIGDYEYLLRQLFVLWIEEVIGREPDQ